MALIITSMYIFHDKIIGTKLIEPSIRSVNGHHYDNFICHPLDNFEWQGRGAKKLQFKVQHKLLQLCNC
jgi:hypothetical protein